MRIITIANKCKCRPSEVIGEIDPYLAFCLDDVCVFIDSQRYIDENGYYKWHVDPDWNFKKRKKAEEKKQKDKNWTSNSEKIEELRALEVRLRGGR